MLTKEVIYNQVFLGSLRIQKIKEDNKEVNAKVFYKLN